MTENEAITRMKYRIDTATDIAGKGADGKAFEDMEIAIKSLEEIQQYREIGTVEECREAMERQRAKKPIKYDKHYYKCVCGAELSVTDDDLYIYGCEPPKYCEKCGQVLSWECDTD